MPPLKIQWGDEVLWDSEALARGFALRLIREVIQGNPERLLKRPELRVSPEVYDQLFEVYGRGEWRFPSFKVVLPYTQRRITPEWDRRPGWFTLIVTGDSRLGDTEAYLRGVDSSEWIR